MTHEIYVHILAGMFIFWNAVRILAYFPTIAKLLKPQTDPHSYSLVTWGAFSMSSGTLALMLLESNHGYTNMMVFMALANTLMCLAMCLVIYARTKLTRNFARRGIGMRSPILLR